MAGAGRLLVRVDPLPTGTPADAIYVLGGSRVDRWLQAAELYDAGAAPRILLSRGGTEPAEILLASRGITVPTWADIGRTILVERLGVPAGAVEVLPEPVDNTAHEAEAIRDRVAREGWTRLIVITGRSATRRASFAFERVLDDRVQVIMRDARFDDYDPVWWWRSRGSARQTFYELPKLLAYWVGLGA